MEKGREAWSIQMDSNVSFVILGKWPILIYATETSSSAVSHRHQLLHFQPETSLFQSIFWKFSSIEYECPFQPQRKLFKHQFWSNTWYQLILKYRTLKMNMKNGSSETVTLVCNAKQSNRYGRTFGSILASFKSALRSKLQLFSVFTLYRFKISPASVCWKRWFNSVSESATKGIFFRATPSIYTSLNK